MKKRYGHFLFFGLILFTIGLSGCGGKAGPLDASWLNEAHLVHLIEPIVFQGDSVEIVHIYCEYPDYEWVGDPDEGITCVDDVARAAVFYLRNYHYTGNLHSKDHALKLLKFVEKMQAPNGAFYNFIFRNGKINKTHENSRARAGWWTWRAIWAMGEAACLLGKEEPDRAKSWLEAMERVFPLVDSLLAVYPKTRQSEGLVFPDWLPFGTAGDQAGVLLLALNQYAAAGGPINVETFRRRLLEGILQMQAGDKNMPPYGAFLSWQNTWHAWGNVQATSVLQCWNMLNQSQKKVVLRQADYFLPWQLKEGFLNEFALTKSNNGLELLHIKRFPQIAYGIRPMVWAALEAYRQTGQEEYGRLAGQLAGWFFGQNPANAQMYFPENGRCYDGIISVEKVNRNAGAESTIEALLALQEVRQNPIAAKQLQAFINSKRKKENQN